MLSWGVRWWILLLIACDSGTTVDAGSEPDVPLDAVPVPVRCDDPALADIPDQERDVDVELRGPRPILFGGAGADSALYLGASCWRVVDASPDSGIDVGDLRESATSSVSVTLVHPESWVLLEGRARDIDGQLWSTHARISREAQAHEFVSLVRNEPVVGYGADDGLLATSHHIGSRYVANTVLQVLSEETWLENRDGAIVLHDRETVSPIDADPTHLFLTLVPYVNESLLVNGTTLAWLEGEHATLETDSPVEQAEGQFVVADDRVFVVNSGALTEVEAPPNARLIVPRWTPAFVFSGTTLYSLVWGGDEPPRTQLREELGPERYRVVGDLVAVTESGEYWGETGFTLAGHWTPMFGRTAVSYEEAYALPEEVTLRAAHISYHQEWFAFGNDESTWEAFMQSMNPDD